MRLPVGRGAVAAGALAAGVLASACEHSAPFTPADVSTTQPFATGSPARITFSPGDDRTAAWFPDGSGILYSSEQLDRRDHDRCLVELPPAGGTIRRRICHTILAYDDSVDRFESPAIASDRRLAFYTEHSRIGLQKNGNGALMLGSLDQPLASARRLTLVPYQAPNGRMHSAITQLQWLSPTQLVYVAQMIFWEGSTFLPDTFYTGLDVVVADVSGADVALSVVPGTDYASGVAADPLAPGIIYFTLGGDSRVYRYALADGARSVAYDFGPGHIAREIAVSGTTLVAIVDGSVLFGDEPAHGPVQRDEGGDLWIVTLPGGAPQVYSNPTTLFRRPALAPGGRRLVVEASPRVPVHQAAQSDFTAINHRPDLWLFDVP
ncbi:MAG: PD40 domain-containing protein [Gemmatimonadales bacterium]|nr:PD40 domain-containing protein [Gemmatimonadales bacterium]